MKLMFRLGLTLAGLLLIMVAAYLALPAVVAAMIQSQLKQQGFDTVKVSGVEVSPGALSIAQLQLSDTTRAISLRDVQLGFTLPGVLDGKADSLAIEQLEIHPLPAEARGFSLPDPLLLPGVLKLLGAQSLPLNTLRLGRVIVYDNDARALLTLSGQLSQAANEVKDVKNDAKEVRGYFQITDINDRRYLLQLIIQQQAGIELTLREPDRADEHILEILTQPSADGRAMLGSISLDTFTLLEHQGFAGLSGRLRADFSYGAGVDSDQPSFTLSLTAGDLRMGAQSLEAVQLDARGTLLALEEGGVHVAFLPQSSLQLRNFAQDDISLESLSVRLPESLRISAKGVQLPDNSGARLDIRQLKLGDIQLHGARLEQLSFTQGPSQCAFLARLNLQALKQAGAQLQLEPIDLHVNCPLPGQSAWSLQLNTAAISYLDADLRLAAERCQLTIGNSRDQRLLVPGKPAELGGRLACERSPLSGALSSDFRFNTRNGVGRADYTIVDIYPDVDSPLFSTVLKDWTVPFEIVSGHLQIQGRYRWWRTPAGRSRDNLQVDLQAQNLGGHYEGVLFSGLSYTDSIELLPRLRSRSGAARLTISDIDVGIVVSDFTSSLSFSPSPLGPLPIIAVNEVQMRLLDGKLMGERLTFDLNAAEQDFEMKVQGLDLAQLVALQNLDGLSASGRLDGVIPLRITPQGVTIQGGRIFAENQGGRIQYLPSKAVDASQKSVPVSDKVLRVLDDLRYDTLEIGVDYSEQGDLRMQLALKGISPGVDPHRPVHFNVTLEQNLLTLLRGLRYAEGINRDIDRNVRKHFEQQQ